MVVTVNAEKIVKRVLNRELVLFVKHMASQSIKGEQLVVLLGGHHGRTSTFLVGHMAEVHGKWPMAACYF